jgi:osmotically-inducible protein OsmY
MDEPSPYAAERVREALAADPRVGELDIHVQLAGDRVLLTGSVTTEVRHRIVSEIVEGLLPHHEVCNELEVVDSERRPSEERLP